jgi:hypothetical protein
VRAKDGVWFELFHKPRKPNPRAAGKQSLNPIEPARHLWVVRLGKQHSPQLRRVLDQFHVAIRVNLPVQRRIEFCQIQSLDYVTRPQRAPGFVQRRRGGKMSGAGCDCGNQDAHSGKGVLPNTGSLPEFNPR